MTAEPLAERLCSLNLRIVFAESCTAGLVSAKLAMIPGVSSYHCGSQATYREQSKIDWLGVSADSLAKETAVSDTVTREMAAGVLERTVEADIAVAVTGHLGPNAPESLDGVVFVAALRRGADLVSTEIRLQSTGRAERLEEAAEFVLGFAAKLLADDPAVAS